MHPSEAIQELNALSQQCSLQQYQSHYPLKQRLDELEEKVSFPKDGSVENQEIIQKFQAAKSKVEVQLSQLEKSNEQMIKELKFEATCVELVKTNDLANLKGLIDIGHYFGTGFEGRDVCVALDRIYDFFRTNSSLIKASNKPCMDYLSDSCKRPRLQSQNQAPANNFQMYPDPRKRAIAILKADSVNDLMVWLLSANQADRDYALRASASIDSCPQCLMFLLRRTSAEKNQQRGINLLAAGQPSGQIALHRAILSGKTIVLSMLLDEDFNPSDDLLKQLLVRDKNGLTPIDCIGTLKEDEADLIDRSRMIERIKEAFIKYQTNPKFGLTSKESDTINLAIVRIQIALALEEEGLGESLDQVVRLNTGT